MSERERETGLGCTGAQQLAATPFLCWPSGRGRDARVARRVPLRLQEAQRRDDQGRLEEEEEDSEKGTHIQSEVNRGH